MGFKPIRIGVWYDVDGGGNPHDSKLIYFSQAHPKASAIVTSNLEVTEVSSPSAGTAAKSQSESLAELRARAEEGNLAAQFALGMAYHEGTDVAKDEVEAVKWFRMAAERGHADSQFFLGGMCYSGAGVEKDYIEAFKWFLLAARQGDPLASLPLKQMSDTMSPTMVEEAKRRADDFRFGGSLKVGDTQAQHDEFEKLKAKAEQGDAIAQSNLGVAYAEGKGVGKDDTEATRWYRKAAEQGFAVAQFNLARAYADGRGVSKDDVEAAKWYRKSADQGFAYAQIMLSAMYNSGRGVPQSDHEAATLLLKAAEQGVPIAQHYIGLMYGAGKGVTEDYIEAYKWLSLAAARGVEESLRFIEALSQKMAPAMLEEAKKRAATWQPSGGL